MSADAEMKFLLEELESNPEALLALLMMSYKRHPRPRSMYASVFVAGDLCTSVAAIFDVATEKRVGRLTVPRGERMLRALTSPSSIDRADINDTKGALELRDLFQPFGSCPHMHARTEAMLALDEQTAPPDCVKPPSAMHTLWRGVWNPLLHLVWQPAMRLCVDGTHAPIRYWLNGSEMLFSFAIPTVEALRKIRDASGGRVMELAAGSGYWAALLASLGTDVVACDTGTEAEKTVGAWHPVTKQTASTFCAQHAADRALLVVYPRVTDEGDDRPNVKDLADAFQHYAATRKHTGGIVCVVGERPSESTDNLAGRLYQEGWRIKASAALPQWPHKHDTCVVMQAGLAPHEIDTTPLGLELARVFGMPLSERGAIEEVLTATLHEIATASPAVAKARLEALADATF